MPNLTDYIEDYLKRLLSLSGAQYIEIRRRELASKFSCVPSQINYVLARRFTPERGYLVESRRGGGGFIRIYRTGLGERSQWAELLGALAESDLDPEALHQLVTRMKEEKLVSSREARLLSTLVRDSHYRDCALGRAERQRLQRRLLGAAAVELLKAAY